MRKAPKKKVQKKKRSARSGRGLLLFVVGISGAGKSITLDALEDAGFFSIDNLPVSLVEQFVEFSKQFPRKYKNVAILLNIETSRDIERTFGLMKALERERHVEVVFLDSQTEVIIRRYSETRRPHPRFDPELDSTIQDTILREKERLFPLKEAAQVVIDTTGLTVHDLKREVKLYVSTLRVDDKKPIRINFVSFGFKYGIPPDCDLVADVRFLPNPHFVPGLREKTGMDKKVRDYVLARQATHLFIRRYTDLLKFLLPQYVFEGKSYLNVGIGCTGGKHRSVVIAHELYKALKSSGYLLSVRHRDIEQ